MYKTVVLTYDPRANGIAKAVEEEANRQEADGFELVSFAITPSAKPVLIFHKADIAPKQQ